MKSDASDTLPSRLKQMDGNRAGSKALEYSSGIFDCHSPTSPFMGSSRALHLVEDLRGLLEMMETEERNNLRSQIPDSTAEMLIEWLQSQMDHKLEKKKKRSALVGIASWIRCRLMNRKDSQESSLSQLLTSFPESKKISRGSMKLFGSDLDTPFYKWTKEQVSPYEKK